MIDTPHVRRPCGCPRRDRIGGIPATAVVTRAPVLVRGVGEIGSAIAHLLFRAGCPIALHDGPAPTVHRRDMAFADAVFDGTAEQARPASSRSPSSRSRRFATLWADA